MYRDELIEKLTTIPDDMPLFLVKGSDPEGGNTVRFWTAQSEKGGVHERKLLAAEGVAVAMDDYPHKKRPD